MIPNSIKNGCKNLYLHPKSFKITLKPNSYLMSVWRPGPVNPSTHTFCYIDVAQTMAYWFSQKIGAYYENIIRNLEGAFKLFWNTISSFCGWFICCYFQAIVWSMIKAGRSSLNILFQCVRQVDYGCNIWLCGSNSKWYSKLFTYCNETRFVRIYFGKSNSKDMIRH